MNLNIKFALPTSALVLLALHFYRSHSHPRTTRLRGPASKSLVFGVTEDILASNDLGELSQNWEKAHGAIRDTSFLLLHCRAPQRPTHQ